jgi:hypothetical protein
MVEQMKNLFGSSFVSFDNQKLSGDMALQGSRDGSLATIDLSSASDRLSCYVVERLFRKCPSLVHALHASRTRYIRDDISGETPIFVKMKKFASQGTAVTFPVQTLCFLIIALGSNIQGEVTWTKIRRLRDKVRVFGDDIIIPNTGYADTVRVLTKLGLKVNMEKSFHKGYFRESCGVDAFMGYDITPCKLTRAVPDGPSSRQAIIDQSNNLYKKGYWVAAKRLESTMGRSINHLPITALDDSTVGLISFCGRKLDHLAKRWNDSLSRFEWKVLSNKVSIPKVRPGGIPALLQCFTVAKPRDLPREHGYTGRPKLRDKLRWDPLY